MDLNPCLRLDARFTHLVSDPDHLVLVGEDDWVLLTDPASRAAARLVDGTRSAVDIAEDLAEEHAREVVHFSLMSMEEHGLIGTRPAPVGSGPGGGNPARDSTPPLPSHSPGSPALATALSTGWGQRTDGQIALVPGKLVSMPGMDLLLVEDYLDPALADVVERTLAEGAGKSVLLARVGSGHVWLGPVLGAAGSACLACLQDRLRLNRPARTLIYPDRSGDGTSRFQVTSLGREIPPGAFHGLADLVDSLLGPLGRPAPQDLLVRPVGEVSKTLHPIPRLPHCAVCGDPTLTVPGAEIVLQSRSLVKGSGSGYRTTAPLRTFKAMSPLISPITGVVRELREMPVPGHRRFHTFTANHPNHYGPASMAALRDEGRDHSGGKGVSELDARVSALCESLERFSSVHRGNESLRLGRASALGSGAVSPGELLRFSQTQYEGRQEWNRLNGGGFQWIPESYADQEIEWSPVRSLVSGEVKWVPSAALFSGFHGEGDRFCDGDSNGLAGGNCAEEAVLQGLLEVVERDAVALWWYNRVSRPGVDLGALDDRWCAGVREDYTALGRELWALDLTTDVNIPTFVAISALEDREIIFGFGAHLDAEIALRRAISEVNQMLPSVLDPPEERDRKLGREFPDAVQWWREATLKDHPYLLPGSSPRVSIPSADEATGGGDLRDHVLDCIARVAGVGCDVLVHDLTRPDVKLAVVKVMVPGMRHFWRRLGPGRLYDVPVQLGWMPAPSAESDLNPVSMFV